MAYEEEQASSEAAPQAARFSAIAKELRRRMPRLVFGAA